MAYSCSSGVCQGTDADTTSAIKLLQREVNRFATDPDIGFQPIAVDGVIGTLTTTATLYALTSISLMSPDLLAGTSSHPQDVASNLIDMINAPSDLMQLLNDTTNVVDLGATLLSLPPLDANAPAVASKPGAVAKSTNAAKAAAILAKKPGLAASGLLGFPIPNWLAYGSLALLVGGIGYNVAKKHGYIKPRKK